jgi:hypothetical protein
MRTLRAVLLGGILACCALSTPAAAQDKPDDIKANCEKYDALKDTGAIQRWKPVAELAGGVRERYCNGTLSPGKLPIALLEFLSEASRELESMGIDNEKTFPFRQQLPKAKAIVDADRGIPTMTVLPPGGDIGLNFEGPVKVTDVPKCDTAVATARAANRVTAQSCRQLLQSLQASYAPLQSLVQWAYTKEVKQYLEGLERQWDDFLTQSRSQTALELAVNSYFWRKGKTSGMFLEPPTWQLVLLHPSVVLEYVDKAADGNRQEEGLMIEAVGANWWNLWQSEKWYLPTGASYVLVYSDRAGLRDWANGVAVYFSSKYTLGATRRNGETGIFISVDLLELFKDKKKTLDDYTRNLPKELRK